MRAEEQAQSEYNTRVALLRSLYGNGIDYEIAKHQELGFNSLKLLLDRFGEYEAGWMDNEIKPEQINRLIAFNRQDIVSCHALSSETFRKVYSIEKSLRQIKLLVFILITIITLSFTALFF